MVDREVRALADSAPNFGYLLEHEQLLVMYGATAEALVYTDANTAMIKCRQFGEALTARAFIQSPLARVWYLHHVTGPTASVADEGVAPTEPDLAPEWILTLLVAC